MATNNKNKGALGTDPKFVVSEDAKQRARQLNKWETLAKRGDKSAQANIAAIKAYKAPGSTQSPGPTQEQTSQYNDTIEQGNQAQQDQFSQISKQGAFNPQTMGISRFNYQGPQVQQFNPGDFQQQFQGAYDSALNQFERSSKSAFDRQNQDFQQMAAERGWDPSSKVYQDSLKQIQDSQNTARLNAQDAAYQTGLGAQQQVYGQQANTYGQNLAAQGQQFGQYNTGFGNNLNAQGQQFGQAATQYQMPYQNLSMLSPYLQAQYGQQMGQQQQGYSQANSAQAQEYAKELAAIQQKYALQLQNNAPRGGGGGGGGGLSLADQMALQNNAFYNNMVLGGLAGGQQQPGIGNSALQGVASGIGAGIASGLVK